MPPLNPNSYIKKLSNVSDTLSVGINESIPGIQDDIYADLIELVSGLDKDATGNIKSSLKNINQVNKIRTKLSNTILSDDYNKAVSDYLDGFSKLDDVNNAYFSTFDNFDPSKELFQSVKDLSLSTTKNSLLDTGVSENVVTPLVKGITDIVAGGGTYKDLLNFVGTTVKGDSENLGALARYTSQISTDAVYQYNRSYVSTVAKDLKVTWYLFEGSEKSTTRYFCHIRKGGFFTKKEIEYWGNTPSLWVSPDPKKWSSGGMITGTNSSNIFTYLGGYNCEHIPIPVSEKIVPQKDKDRAKELGFA